jgi:hypothetical protein
MGDQQRAFLGLHYRGGLTLQPIRVVAATNLGADFRGVGSKIVIDSVTGGAGSPPGPPPEPDKIWQWWDTTTSRMTHLWLPVAKGWAPMAAECEGCAALRAEVAALRAAILTAPTPTPVPTPTPSNCVLEFANWDLSNGTGNGRLRAANGRTIALTTTARNGARIDWSGNGNAQRDIPLSQAHAPAVAGASTFRTQITWDASPEAANSLAATDAGSVLAIITPSEATTNPVFYVENLGQAVWDGQRNVVTSVQLDFQNSDRLEKLSSGPHLIVQGKAAWRAIGGQGQDLGRSTDDLSGEAAGWLRIIGTFGPSRPIEFVISPAPNSPEGRAQDAIAFTIPFLTCT